MRRCLGRLPHNPAKFALVPQSNSYLDASYNAVDWSRDVAPGSWGELNNDNIGDCTSAALGHALLTWGVYEPPATLMTDNEAESLYSATSGYIRGKPETDQGALCLDVLSYALRVGVQCGGKIEKLLAFCRVDPLKRGHVMAAISAFGGLYAGVTLHEAQEDETIWNDLTSPVIGGHCAWVVAADGNGLTGVTWGETRRMTWDWWRACTDEVYALLSPRWINAGRAPQGLKLDALTSVMDQVKDYV